ncbi:hypothetical protein SNEBB_009157 [Seison nebaliae]|nr:hypothetical protein SNEBB_009157 [Seison nebaliae]
MQSNRNEDGVNTYKLDDNVSNPLSLTDLPKRTAKQFKTNPRKKYGEPSPRSQSFSPRSKRRAMLLKTKRRSFEEVAAIGDSIKKIVRPFDSLDDTEEYVNPDIINDIYLSMKRSSNGKQIYHERQHLQLCAVHALNNLFQSQMFDRMDFDDICLRLDENKIFNAHRSMMGLGRYDINVISIALNEVNHKIIWFNKNRSIKQLRLEKIKGFLLNVPSRYNVFGISLPFMGEHWMTITKVDGEFIEIDSKVKNEVYIDDINEHMKQYLEQTNSHILVVCETKIADDDIWDLGEKR